MSRTPLVRPGANVSESRWAAIFGKPAAIAARRQRAVARQQAASRKAPETLAPAIHDDGPYRRGLYSPCLGEKVFSRTQIRELARQGVHQTG